VVAVSLKKKELLRRRLSERSAQRIARIVIVIVCVAALIRSLWLLPGHLS
jgi:Na+/proline symporter